MQASVKVDPDCFAAARRNVAGVILPGIPSRAATATPTIASAPPATHIIRRRLVIRWRSRNGRSIHRQVAIARTNDAAMHIVITGVVNSTCNVI